MVHLLKSGVGAGECGSVGVAWWVWFMIPCIIHTGDDTLLAQAWNAIGDYYADRQKFGHAVTYFNHARNYPQLAECYYRLEDFAELKRLVDVLPPNHPTLDVRTVYQHGLIIMCVVLGCCQEVCDSWYV